MTVKHAIGVRCFLVNIKPNQLGEEHVGKIVTIVGVGHKTPMSEIVPEWEISPAFQTKWRGKLYRIQYANSPQLLPIEPPPELEDDVFSANPLSHEKQKTRVDNHV